jgi:hypothetical protein
MRKGEQKSSYHCGMIRTFPFWVWEVQKYFNQFRAVNGFRKGKDSEYGWQDLLYRD